MTSFFGILIRGRDQWGDGAYHASRDGGGRLHEGIDLAVWPGTPVLAPFSCKVIREAIPYPNDPRYSGLLLGLGDGLELKLLYVDPVRELIGQDVAFATRLGRVQDLRDKYQGITPHVHVELWRGGKRIDPSEVVSL